MAPRKQHLTAVPPDARAPKPPKPPQSIVEALDGSAVDVLRAMRRALAKQLDSGAVSSNSIASASKELRELDRLIRSHEQAAAEAAAAAAGESDVDDRFDASAI